MSKKRKNIFKDLKVESIGFEGISIARDEGMVYFVKGGVPGDLVKAKLLKKRKKYTEAIIEEIIEASEDRIEPKCSYFDYCGGCSWQNISYQDQLSWKKRHVEDAISRIAGIKDIPVHDTFPSSREFHYRNKMDFTFGASRWLFPEEIERQDDIANKDFALGLHVRGRFDKILDIDFCHIQPEIGNKILDVVRKKALEMDISAYHVFHKEGFLRNLVLRKSLHENSIMLIFVTKKVNEDKESKYIAEVSQILNDEFPEIKSIIHAVNDEISPVAIGKIDLLYGEEFITEKILDVEFKISPFSFFQTNSYQLNPFISKIIEYAELKNDEIVWDLYCGTGSITLPAAKKCKQIYGIELVESSIEDAKNNALRNEITNAEFTASDLHHKDIPELLGQLPKPDVLIIDPPRAGMHKNLLSHILEIKPERIVYVSCNPATQARDLALLDEHYRLIEVQPFDMFPQTYHIESIAKLELRK